MIVRKGDTFLEDLIWRLSIYKKQIALNYCIFQEAKNSLEFDKWSTTIRITMHTAVRHTDTQDYEAHCRETHGYRF